MAVIQQSEPSVSVQERRLQRAPYMLAVIMAFMWITFSAEAQTILPLLQTLEKQYNMSPVQGAWAISVLGIVSAAVVGTLSRAADLWGVRKILLISLATIIVGNVLSAVSPGAALFLVGRAVAGFTAATPLLMAIFRLRAETQHKLDRNMGILTACQGIGLVLSFLLGGIIISAGGSARTAIWVIVILGAVVYGAVYFFIPDSPVRARVKLDYGGSLFLGAGLALVVIALGEGNSWGWKAGSTLGLLLGGAVLLVFWGFWETRVSQPMIDVRIMARRSVLPAFLVSAIIAMLGTCNTLAVAQWVETPGVAGYGFGATVLLAGAYLLPVGVVIAGGGPFMAPVIRRLGQRNAAVLGAVIACADFLWFMGNHSQSWEFVVELLVFGAAYVLAQTAANSGYMRGARIGESGMVAGAGNVVVIAAQALGPTLTIAILTATTIPRTPIPLGANYGHAWLMMACFAAVTALVALLMRESAINQSLAPNAAVAGATPVH